MRELFDKYLRSLQDRLEDIKGEIETRRSVRGYYQDAAALDRIDAAYGAVSERAARAADPRGGSRGAAAIQYEALNRAYAALSTALGQSEELVKLNKSSNELRLTKRGLDRFLTAIMEGRIKEGQEAFGAFLFCLICVPAFALVNEENIKLLEIYISLRYGNPKKPLSIPVVLATKYKLWPQEFIRQKLEENFKLERIREYDLHYAQLELKRQEILKQKRDKKHSELTTMKEYEITGRLGIGIKAILKASLLYDNLPALQKLLTPHLTAKFDYPWINKCEDYDYSDTYPLVHETKLSWQQYREGTVVTTVLIVKAIGDGLVQKSSLSILVGLHDIITPYVNMLVIPSIVGKEPLEVVLLIKKINETIQKNPEAVKKVDDLFQKNPIIVKEKKEFYDYHHKWNPNSFILYTEGIHGGDLLIFA
jgi:hypothetical protein